MTDTTPTDAAREALIKRLRGYNPPDRTIDSQRQIAQDIHDAADALEQARAASVPAQESVGEWRMKNGEPMHVLWRARYKPQLGDKLYATPPADSAKADNIDQEN